MIATLLYMTYDNSITNLYTGSVFQNKYPVISMCPVAEKASLSK